jgi:hypothetical protein
MTDIMAYFYGFIDLKEYIRRRKMQEPTIADLLFKPGAETIEFDGDERVK